MSRLPIAIRPCYSKTSPFAPGVAMKPRRSFLLRSIFVAAVALVAGQTLGQPAGEPKRGSVAAWDTGTSSSQPLAPDALQGKEGWKALAADENAPAFEGDAAITNGRLLAVA